MTFSCKRIIQTVYYSGLGIAGVMITSFIERIFSSDKPQNEGLPSVVYCTEALHLSSNYFGELMKKETGSSALEYIQSKVIDVAKEKLYCGFRHC